MIINEKIENGKTTSKVKFFRIRVILGDLLLILGVFFIFILVAMLHDILLLPDQYPFDSQRQLIFIRNFSITAFGVLFGSYLGYGRWLTPFKGRKFDPESLILRQKFGNRFWRYLILMTGSLVAFFGLFGFLGMLMLWEEGNIESLVIGYLPMAVPTTIFGLKWIYTSLLLNPKRYTYLDAKDKPLEATLLDQERLNEVTRDKKMDQFGVTKPSAPKWLLILIISALLNITTLVYFISNTFQIILSFSSIIIALIGWRILSPWITKIFVINTLKRWNEQVIWHKMSKKERKLKKKPKISIIRKIILYLLGLNLSLDKKYYIETTPHQVNLNNLKEFLSERALDLILICISMVFILLFTLNPIFGFLDYVNSDPYFELFKISLFLVLSPIFAFLAPVIWIVHDLNIKSVDENQTVERLVDSIQSSQVDRFLGLGGFLSGISVISLLHESYPVLSAYGGQWPNKAALIIESLFTFVLFILMFAGIAYLVGILHLTLNHQKIVNKFRKEIASFLPVCTTVARKITTEEEEIFKRIISNKNINTE